MRNALSILSLVGALTLAACGGGGSDSSSSLRLRCIGGQTFCIISCDLGCTQTGCSVSEIAENQRLRFKFSDEVDSASVNGASISIRTATGVAPAGDFIVSGNEVVFEPSVTTVNGISSFGFQRNESYIITLAGGSSVAQSVTNLAGDGLSQEFTCTVVASRGILDEDQQPPTVELISPTVTSGAPRNPTIVLRFSELIDTTPLQASLSESSPIRVVLRGVQPSGECDNDADGIALSGVPQISTELVGERDVTVVTWAPSADLPGNSCIDVRVTADLRDLSGRSAIPARFVFTTEAGVVLPFTITETFASPAQQESLVSGGVWMNGAHPGVVGGDGRHGSFDPALGDSAGGGVYIWDTTNFAIPASTSLTGQDYQVTDGRFYFTDMVIPAGTTVRFVGPNMPILRVRGRVDIQGRIEVNGEDLPSMLQTAGPAAGMMVSTFNARTGTLQAQGQPGSNGGCGGGAGGNGGLECQNTGAIFQGGINLTNGQPGEAVQLSAAHAYGGNAAVTRGAGSVLMPSNGIWASPAPTVSNVYCAYFSAGGSGGGFALAGSSADTPVHNNVSQTIQSDPAVGAGQPFSLMPYPPVSPPANYTSLDHFMVGGSGGGGGGSHGYGLIALGTPQERWMAGHAGTGGGGTLAIRAGGAVSIGNTAVLQSRGGDGTLICGDDPTLGTVTDTYGISSPGGGGSGGSFLIQSGQSLSFSGQVDARGGQGSVVGFVNNTLQRLSAAGGDGAPGYFRLEAANSVSFSGSSTPAFVAGENDGTLTDRDDRSGDQSLWYNSNRIFPPTWLRYELDVDLDGDGTVDITYTDSGEAGTQLAYEVGGPTTLPLVIEFQGADLDPANDPVEGSIGEWRSGIGTGAGSGISVDAVTAFRFKITYNLAIAPNLVVKALRVYAQS